jgi:hypothetical protein
MLDSEMKGRKQPDSVDSIIEAKFNVIVDVIDKRLEEVYKEFNLAMEAKSRDDQRMEQRLVQLVNVLSGALNEQRIRLITLENHVLEHKLGTPEELEEQYLENVSKFKEASGWKEIPLNDLATDEAGVNPLDSASLPKGTLDSNSEKPF